MTLESLAWRLAACIELGRKEYEEEGGGPSAAG